MAFQNSGRVHYEDSGHVAQRDNFQFVQDGFDIRGGLGLNGADHNILAAFLPTASLIQHPKRFADSRRVTEEHFQPAPALILLFGLDLLQQFLRGAASNRAGHGLLPLLPLGSLSWKVAW